MRLPCHGTYVSYHALVHPECTQGVTYHGPQQNPADCGTGAGCVPSTLVGLARGQKRHFSNPALERDGIRAPSQELIYNVAEEIDTTVKHIEFPRGAGGGPMIRAKVWFFKIQQL